MILRTIKSLLALLPQVAQQGAEKWGKKPEKPRLFDIVEARFLSEEARRRKMELSALLKEKGAAIERSEQRQAVEHKVRALIAPFYQHAEIIDEVTEKLANVAAHDPFYKRWFAT